MKSGHSCHEVDFLAYPCKIVALHLRLAQEPANIVLIQAQQKVFLPGAHQGQFDSLASRREDRLQSAQPARCSRSPQIYRPQKVHHQRYPAQFHIEDR